MFYGKVGLLIRDIQSRVKTSDGQQLGGNIHCQYVAEVRASKEAPCQCRSRSRWRPFFAGMLFDQFFNRPNLSLAKTLNISSA